MTITEAKNKLIAWCNAQVGTKEGANNYNKYAESADVQKLFGWNVQNQPWCATFTNAGFIACFGLETAAAMTYQTIGKGSAACRYAAQFFKGNGAWYTSPELGDVVFFYVSGEINHQGIVTAVNGKTFITVEGNSSDMVARRTYTVGSAAIAGFGRPKWSLVADVPDSGTSATTTTTTAQPAAPTFTLTFRELKAGCTGEDVRALQRNLKALGIDIGRYGADGDFGNDTRNAVVTYQKSVRLSADGIVGKNTMSHLLGLN